MSESLHGAGVVGWSPAPPPEDRAFGGWTVAEMQFVEDMRIAARKGVGYGWMQQVTEWEWQHRGPGAWGPEYYEREAHRMAEEIERLGKCLSDSTSELTTERASARELQSAARNVVYFGERLRAYVPAGSLLESSLDTLRDVLDKKPTPERLARCSACGEPIPLGAAVHTTDGGITWMHFPSCAAPDLGQRFLSKGDGEPDCETVTKEPE